MTDRGFRVTGPGVSGNVRRLMYQTLIWALVLRDESGGLGTALDAKDCERLTNSLVDGVRRNFELGRDFLGRQQSVDEAETIELASA